MQPFTHDRPDAVGHDIARRPPVYDGASLRLFRGERAISLSKFFMKFERFTFETVGNVLPAPALGAGEPDLGWNVENKRQRRNSRAHRHALQTADQSLVNIAEGALVDPR